MPDPSPEGLSWTLLRLEYLGDTDHYVINTVDPRDTDRTIRHPQPGSTGHNQANTEDQSEAPTALIASCTQTPRVPCPDCSQSFLERKTLYRHRRTVHGSRKFECFHCAREFKRQDILVRHMQTQHESETDMVQCHGCGKEVRPRSLPCHWKRCPAQNLARSLAQTAELALGSCDVRTAAPIYLAALADPIMLGVNLIVKFRPWGRNHRWLKSASAPDPFMRLSNEVRDLQQLTYEHLLRAMGTTGYESDNVLPDILSILVYFVCQTEGWEASLLHAYAMVTLAVIQIRAQGGDPTTFMQHSSAAADVFHTILLRNVPASDVADCEWFLLESLSLMRRAAVTTASQVHERKVIDSKETWYRRWEPQLKPIADTAALIPC